MSVRKIITVTHQQDLSVTAQQQAGRLTNDTGSIDNGARREEASDEYVAALRKALIAGERSGEPLRFDFAAFARRKRRQHGV